MQGLAFDLFQHFSSSSRAAEFFIGKSWTGKTVSRRQAHVSWEWMLRIQCVYIYIIYTYLLCSFVLLCDQFLWPESHMPWGLLQWCVEPWSAQSRWTQKFGPRDGIRLLGIRLFGLLGSPSIKFKLVSGNVDMISSKPWANGNGPCFCCTVCGILRK